MIKNALTVIGITARRFLLDWRASVIFSVLYAALLAALYLFVSTKEATTWQLVMTALYAVAAPILLLAILSASVNYITLEGTTGTLMRRTVRDFWKVLVIGLPLLMLAIGVAYALHRLQVRYGLPADGSEQRATEVAVRSADDTGVVSVTPLRWINVLFTSLRLLLLGIALPLVAIHLWIMAARDGFGKAIKNLFRVVASAFAPQSLMIYGIGLFVFALVPYFLIFTRTPVDSGWLEVVILSMRLTLAFVFTLWGWVITVGALATLSAETTRDEATRSAAGATEQQSTFSESATA